VAFAAEIAGLERQPMSSDFRVDQKKLTQETYNGITLGTYLFAVPSLSNDLTEAIKTRGSIIAFLPINFCKRCLLHYDLKPSHHKCPKKSEAKKADSHTSAPCGEEQCNTPPTGSCYSS